MACPRCGSLAVRADRALAGRLVCGHCGIPLNGVHHLVKRSRSLRFLSTPFPVVALLVLALAAVLASFDSSSPSPSAPHGSTGRSHHWRQ